MMISTHHLAVLAGIAGMPGTFTATAATVFDPTPAAEYCTNENGISYNSVAIAPPAPEDCATICGELDSLAFTSNNGCGVCECFFALGYIGEIFLSPGVGNCPSNALFCEQSWGYDGNGVVCYRAMPDVSGSPSVASSGSPSKPPSGSPSVATSDSPSLLPSGSPSVASSASPSKPQSGSPSVATSDSPSLLPSGSPSVASDPRVDSCMTHSECKRNGLGKEECKGHHGKNKKCRMRKEDCKMFGTKHHGRWSCKQGKKCATMDTDTDEKWGKCIKR